MSNTRFVTVIAIVFSILMFFQNCKARMSMSGQDKGSLVQINEQDFDLPPEPNPGPSPTPNPDPGPTPGPAPAPNPDPGPTPTPTPDPGPNPHPTPTPTPNPHPGPAPTPNPTGHCDGHPLYICDIYKPGNAYALTVGISHDELDVQHTGPKLLCMSKNACEVIVGAAFQGATAKQRGFCNHYYNNKNVTTATDEEMQDLVEEWISNHP